MEVSTTLSRYRGPGGHETLAIGTPPIILGVGRSRDLLKQLMYEELSSSKTPPYLSGPVNHKRRARFTLSLCSRSWVAITERTLGRSKRSG